MEEYLKNEVLNDLYTIRRDGFESKFIKKYGKPKEREDYEDTMKKLKDFYRSKIKNEKDLKEFFEKLEEFIDVNIGELCFWCEQYYKFGFMDALNLIKVEKEQKSFLDAEKNADKDTLIDKFLYQFIEEKRYNVWSKRKDYKELLDKISKIKDEHYNVRIFFEDREIKELTTEELNAVYDIINLYQKIEEIEKTEIFKLGIREGASL